MSRSAPKLPRVRIVLGLAVAAAALWLGIRQLDRWLYPWAFDAPGRGTLTGTWVGRLATGSGQPRAVLLEMHRMKRQRAGRCQGCATIDGTARVCDPQGGVVPYRAGGKPGNRRATEMLIGTVPDVRPPPDGLELSAVRGTWAGPELQLEAELHWRRGGSAVSSSDDPDTNGWVPLRMTRGTEADFGRLCSQLVAR